MYDTDAAAKNLVPSRYRQVALSTDVDALDEASLRRRFIGREAYMRTRFIVVRRAGRTALIEVDKAASSELFAPIERVRVLAPADECRYVMDPEIDVGVPSQLAVVAEQHPGARCVVVEGRYSHVSFILNPAPLRLQVLDIVPPFPSKLFDQVRRVLEVAEDLPPIVPVLTAVDSREVLADEAKPTPQHVLVACRGSGVQIAGATVSYLDERPPHADWTLLGCERSHQIHEWFYGGSPPMVDICPRRFFPSGTADGAVLTRCCLLEEGIEDRPRGLFVPWGSSLDEVRRAIDLIVAREGIEWTPT